MASASQALVPRFFIALSDHSDTWTSPHEAVGYSVTPPLHCTYIDDYVGVANRHFIGVARVMWSSDYPHQASSWPHSQEVVARDFEDANPDDRFKITRGNVARLYGFEL